MGLVSRNEINLRSNQKFYVKLNLAIIVTDLTWLRISGRVDTISLIF